LSSNQKTSILLHRDSSFKPIRRHYLLTGVSL
jgi:hypothetical protein